MQEICHPWFGPSKDGEKSPVDEEKQSSGVKKVRMKGPRCRQTIRGAHRDVHTSIFTALQKSTILEESCGENDVVLDSVDEPLLLIPLFVEVMNSPIASTRELFTVLCSGSMDVIGAEHVCRERKGGKNPRLHTVRRQKPQYDLSEFHRRWRRYLRGSRLSSNMEHRKLGGALAMFSAF